MNYRCFLTSAALAFAAPLALNAQTILYSADFSTEGDGFHDHTSSSPPVAGPVSVSGGSATSPEGRWTASYQNEPDTDTTANEFSVNSGLLRIQDWGDQDARWESFTINVSNYDTVDITAVGRTIGNDVQNGGSEFFEYFHTLDGGAEQVTDVPLSGDTAGTPLDYSVTSLDVTSAGALTVGFNFNVNDGNDGYEIISFVVTGATAGGDTTRPSIHAYSPAVGATGVPVNTGLVLTFSEPVELDAGSITITDESDGTSTATITLPDSRVGLDTATLAIDLTSELEPGTEYSVRIGPAVIKDPAGNYYEGINDSSTWNFTTTSTPPAGPGDLVINEIMQNPSAVGDSSGEWIELHNPTANAIDINGWTISDNASDSHVISPGGPLLVPAGGFLVLGINGDFLTNGGVGVDYVYSGFFLGNDADEVVLTSDGAVEIDRVEYDGGPAFPNPAGASMRLKAPSLDNSIGSSWSPSTAPFGDGDLGTPRAGNGPNPLSFTPADNATGVPVTSGLSIVFSQNIREGAGAITVTDETDGTSTASITLPDTRVIFSDHTVTINLTGNLENDTDYSVQIEGAVIENHSGLPYGGISNDSTWNFSTGAASAAEPGDVVINEIMQNPSAVGDEVGEWFELHNTTGETLDLLGWTISDDDSDNHVISASVVIPAGGFVVFGVAADSGVNGGVTLDYSYGSGFTLANGSDELILTSDAMVEIDRVAWDDGATFPDPAGASMQLAAPGLDNSIGSNWSVSTASFGDGDLGTPGSANSSGAGFSSWAASKGIPDDPNDDSDHDNLTALEEYALGLNPNLPDAPSNVCDRSNPSAVSVTWPKGPEAVDNGDVQWEIQTSATLLPGSWQTTIAGGNPDFISYTLPAGHRRLFTRLKITRSP